MEAYLAVVVELAHDGLQVDDDRGDVIAVRPLETLPAEGRLCDEQTARLVGRLAEAAHHLKGRGWKVLAGRGRVTHGMRPRPAHRVLEGGV